MYTSNGDASLIHPEASPTLTRFYEYLGSSADSAENKARTEDFELWLPSPQTLEGYDKYGHPFMAGVVSLLTVGAMVYERLGKLNGAQECAERALSLHRKAFPLSEGHTCLGRLAKAAGELDRASEHFERAAEHAIKGGIPMLALIAGRDCGGLQGDLLIDHAVKAMGKSRSDFARMGV